MNTNTDFIIHEPAESYHFRSRSGEYMSSHLLADFRESPALYYKEITGQTEEKESAAFTLGRAAHSLILEGRHAFDRDFIVANGPVNPRTGEPFGKTTKAYADWLASQDREVISEKDFAFIMNLQKAVCVHPEALQLLSHGAELFLLDEPTAGLDPIVREQVLELLERLARERDACILFSTHITQDVEKIASRSG